MTKSTALLFSRLFAGSISLITCLGLLLAFFPLSAAAQSPGVSGPTAYGPKIWLQANQPLPVQHVPAATGQGTMADLQGLGQGQPVSMASADLDQDGFQDLVVGYSAGAGGFISVHRGNIDAFAPQSDESFQAIGRGEFPSPFLLEAQTFSVPVRPDFIVLGDFLGTSNQDLAIAAKGGNALYVFPGDGKGNFGAPQAFALPSGVNALAAGRFGAAHQPTLVLGLSGPGKNFSLALYAGSAQGFTSLGTVSLSGPASNILFGDFGDSGIDIAFLSSGKVQIVRPNLQLTTVSLPGSISAFALGSFVYDRSGGLQIAALSSDGSIHVVARSDFDPHVYTNDEFSAIRHAKVNHLPPPAFVPLRSFPTGWQIVESFPGVGSIGAGQAPVLFQTRISINGADDIMWLNAGNGQMAVISHPDGQPGAQTFLPGQVSIKPYNGSPVAALSTRLNVDGRPGVLAIHQGEIAPSLSEPIPDPNFFVNTDNDPTPTSPITNACNNTSFADVSSSCSLREAVLKANGDTINLQAGHTYSLTIGRGATQDYSGNTGALYVNRNATIVGGNQNTTVIQWGTPGTGTVDMVMAVNEDATTTTTATASLSNLTIQNGVNHGASGFDGDGGCMEFDTGTNGTATLSLTNVTLQNCSTLQGGGGGLVIFNFVLPSGAGGATISNSIIQGNSVVNTGSAGIGGGIAVNFDAHMTMTASQVLNNSAVQNCTPTCGLGAGGGIITFAPQNVSAATAENFIHSSTISGNKAAGFGGGIFNGASLSIDQSTVISGNIAGTDGSNNTAHPGQEGGGLYTNTPLPGQCPGSPISTTCTTTLTKVTITGNKATGNGGGISNGNSSGAGSLTMSFSRLAGNTTNGGSGSNLSNNHATATVTNNWWGTNNASSTINTISGTTTFDPFIVLTHTSSPQEIRLNQSATLTANMSNDNHGNGAALSGNLDEIVGLPVLFDGPVLGSIPQAQPETLGNPVPTAIATFNAGGTSGFGTVNATVDQAVVPVNSNLIASATEAGTTATITTVGAHGYSTGEFVRISGVGVAGYNSSPATQVFSILSTPTATTFTYTANTAGLGASSGGTANASIIILQPPSITKSFSPKTIQTTGGSGTTVSTITFSITNGNVVPIHASFTDNLPANVGTVPGSLVVASTPNVVNNCGGSVTATAGSGTISFSNNSTAVGTCTVTVNVQSAVDNIYSNSVTVDSTDAGNGNTASDTLNVINPPHITKSFGVSSIPFGATTSLAITVSNPNQNQTLSSISFTDTLPNNAPGTLVVATPSGLSSTCTGTATGSAGSGSVSLASASLAPGTSCTVFVNVQGTKVGLANNSVTVSDTTGGAGNTGAASETVVKADTTTTVTSSVNPSVFGQSVTFTATVSAVAPGAGTATGTVTFLDGGSPIGTGTLSGGIATFTTSALAVGNHTITTSYGGDGNFNGSTGSLTGNPQVVNKADTATTVTSSVNPSVFGQSVTFTATVSAVAPGAGTATGTVTFLDGGSPIGSGTIIGGIATFTTSALAVGNHTITTNYGGDGNFNGSVSVLTGNPQVVNKANTATTVTSSANPSVFGQSVTFTATVSPVAPGSGTPVGTVTFLDGGSPIGTGTLSGGIATFTTSALAIGNHTITTNYGGDGNFNGSTGSLTGNPQVVNKADTATTVTSSVNPSVFGQSVTFTATVSPVAPGSGTPTGTVTFLDGGSPIGTGTLSGGIATFTTSALATGNHTITTSYGGDGNFNGSTGSLTGNPQVVNKANSTTTVTSSVNPSVFGQAVTFTATVSPVAPGSGTPVGTVTFLDGGSPIGTGTLSGGIATFTTSALGTGIHTITTSYGGDGNFNGSTGSLTGNPQVVNKTDTATTVTSSVNPSIFGQTVTFVATVSPVAPGSGTPLGTVTFLDGGSPIGTGTLIGGVAAFSTSALSIGNHTITTNYGGDGNFNGSTGSLVGNPQIVNKTDTSTTVTSSQNPQTAGQPVTFTATVSAVAPGSGTPTGTVTFLDGGSPFGTGTLSGGIATFTTSTLAPGSHTITTSYGGDGNFNGSTGSLTGNPQVITQASTITSVTSSAGTITLGDTVTFTATVNAASGTATGIVTFFDGSTPLGSAPLNGTPGNDQATFPTSLLSASGSPHSITATYQGATDFAPSTSAPISETVNPRTSTTGVILNPTTVVVGQSSTATVTVTDSGSVPPGTADTFTPTGAPVTGRTGFTSTLLADGAVVIAGGTDANNNVLQSAEVYTISGGTFTTITSNLSTARTGAIAVLLPNGKMLVAGGSSDGTANGALNSAELFDPNTGTFSPSSHNMTAARFGANITLLNTGKVLIAGGVNSGGALNSAELYDPATDTFTATGNLNAARTGASATLLGTGKVLVAGGSSDGTANGALSSAEVFDPAGNAGAGTFTSVAGANPTLAAGRWQPEAALLLSGKVLIAGGQNSGGALNSADLYDPVADSFSPSNQSMSQARANGSAVALPNGMVLLAGGTTSQAADLYDADSDKFNSTGSLQQSDSGLVATLVNNGQVLVVGLTTAATPASDAELYTPSFNPLGTVAVTSSEATDSITGACTLTPSTSTASTCTSTVTPVNVATSPHTITGTYPADAVHSASSNTASLTVNKADTTTTVTSSVNPSVFGQAVTFTATVSPVAPGAGTPTGTVTFLDGGSPIGTGTLAGGVATFTTSALAPGNHTITTSYGGDGNFNGSTGSLTGNPQVVNPSATTTVVTSSLNPSFAGQPVTFTATVSPVAPGAGTPSGTVTFLDGGSPIGTGTLAGGVATFTTSALAPGNHTITTSYGGDANFNGSSGSLTGNPQVVIKGNTTTTVNSTLNPAALGQPVTFNVGVSPVAPAAGLPSGTVTFLDNGNPIGTATLTAAVGSFTTSALAAGNHTITTTYGGDANFNGSTGSLNGNPQVVVAPPAIAKAFNPSAIPLNGTSALIFTITNPSANTVAATGVAFTDPLPAGVVVATPNGLSNTCGGTATATAGSGTISLTGGTVAINSSCTLTVNVTATQSGVFVNTTGPVSSTNGGTGNSATATLGVASPPTIAKAFGANAVVLNGNVGVSFTISNPNPASTLTGIAFTDSLPAGLVVASPNNAASNCGGTVTAVPGSSVINFTGGALDPAGPAPQVFRPRSRTAALRPAISGSSSSNAAGSCVITVSLQANTVGIKNNTTGAISANESGPGNSSNTATLEVIQPPTVNKAFGAATIPLNGSTSLTFNIANPNLSTQFVNIGLNDVLPGGLLVANPNGVTGSCVSGGGVVQANPGGNSVNLSTLNLSASASCSFSVNVTGATAGTKNNVTGNITATFDDGSGTFVGITGGSAAASLAVLAPPVIAKVFNPPAIALNATTQLQFTITNPPANTLALAGVAFTDTLPSGLTVPSGTTSQCGGTLTTTAPGSIALTGASIAANGQCQFSVTVTGATSGQFTNTTGNVTSTNGGTGNTASANLSVAIPPSIVKVFGAAHIPLNGTTSLTFTLNNLNASIQLTGVGFTDVLPAGLVVATPNGFSGTCAGTTTAASGSGTITLTGSTLASSATCSVAVNVTGTTPGVKNNTVSVTSVEGGAGAPSTASITVVAPPALTKAFGAVSIPLGGSTSLSFTVTNPNATQGLSGIGFTDTLPAGLVVSTPNGLTGSCGGGTITAVQGSNAISLSGASLAVTSSCSFGVNVTGTAPGLETNTSGQITSTEGGTGGTASASLKVEAPPVIAKAFNPSAIAPNTSTTLNFTITNPAANVDPLAGVAFTDTLPAGLTVASSSTSACGGTLTTTAPSGIALSGASIAVSGQCQLAVAVASSTPGSFTNTTGNVTSTNGGTGNTATAVLNVAPANLIITKTHTGQFRRGQTGAVFTITVSASVNGGPTDGTTVSVTDTLPAVQNTLVPTALTGAGWTCTLSTLTCTRSDVLAAGASYPAITLTVNVPQNIVNHFVNTATVSGGGDPNTHQATDPVTLGPPVIITSTDSGSATITHGGAATFQFQVDASGVTTLPAVISFKCSGLPAGAACIFNQIVNGNPVALSAAGYSLTQPVTQMTMTITTLGPQVASGRRGIPPTYAALLFPVLGLVGIAFTGRKRKLARSRLTLMLIGLLLLAALAGCGGSPLMTLPGQSTITVTGTVDGTQGAVSGSTTVSLTVQ